MVFDAMLAAGDEDLSIAHPAPGRSLMGDKTSAVGQDPKGIGGRKEAGMVTGWPVKPD